MKLHIFLLIKTRFTGFSKIWLLSVSVQANYCVLSTEKIEISVFPRASLINNEHCEQSDQILWTISKRMQQCLCQLSVQIHCQSQLRVNSDLLTIKKLIFELVCHKWRPVNQSCILSLDRGLPLYFWISYV